MNEKSFMWAIIFPEFHPHLSRYATTPLATLTVTLSTFGVNKMAFYEQPSHTHTVTLSQNGPKVVFLNWKPCNNYFDLGFVFL